VFLYNNLITFVYAEYVTQRLHCCHNVGSLKFAAYCSWCIGVFVDIKAPTIEHHLY